MQKIMVIDERGIMKTLFILYGFYVFRGVDGTHIQRFEPVAYEDPAKCMRVLKKNIEITTDEHASARIDLHCEELKIVRKGDKNGN